MAGYCRACGTEVVLPDAHYCHRCGARLSSQSAEKEPEAEEAASTSTPVAARHALLGDGISSEPDTTSQPSEVRLWEGAYSYRAMTPAWILATCVTLFVGALSISLQGLRVGLFVTLVCAVVVLGGVGLYMAYRRLSVHYELTSQRFLHQAGLLQRISDRIEVIDIDDVAFGQGPIERLLGTGTIKIMSSDRSHPELLLPGIKNVKETATLIDDARRAERRRRGLYIEAI